MTPDEIHADDPHRFVVLFHGGLADPDREDHFDLMLQSGSHLLTWALPVYPLSGPCGCEMLAPHRLEYLTYEGPVSGDRGEVTRQDEGTYELRQSTAELMDVVLHGRLWRGGLRLFRLEGDRWQAEPK